MSNAITNKKIVSVSAKQTQALASQLAKKILTSKHRAGAFVLALKGDLGSGKTTFVQGLAEALGVKDKVVSPTFVIMKKFSIFNFQFSNKKYLYHIDAYRLNKPEEILELGWQEIIANPQNIVAIEWPEKIKKFLPKDTIYLKFKFINETQRRIVEV